MQEYTVHSFDDMLGAIAAFNSAHGHYAWFRGQKDYTWSLKPSVKRPPYHQNKVEQYMATSFYTEACTRMKDHPSHDDMSGWLCLMQHYGLPTRILDWSKSPLVALYFAVHTAGDDDPCNEIDAGLWLMDPMNLNMDQGYGEYIPPMDYRSVADMLVPAFNDKAPSNGKIIACCSVENDLRMYVQQSAFTIHGSDEPLNILCGHTDIVRKLIIPCDLKPQLRLQLKTLGFHLNTIFPDIEHVASEIKNTYAF